MGLKLIVAARVGVGALWRPTSSASELEPVSVLTLGLSQRLVDAFEDWASFFDEIDGDLSDGDVAHEFVSQGFKIAHRLRAEMKGSTVHLIHPVSGEQHEIVR